MRLIIDNPTGEDLKPFIEGYIFKYFTRTIYSLIEELQIKRIDTYLQKTYNNSFIKTKHIITLVLQNLIIYNHQDSYEVTINPNIFISAINAKLYDICALINYGNLELAPYPIFDKTMEKLASFVPQLYSQYKFGE